MPVREREKNVAAATSGKTLKPALPLIIGAIIGLGGLGTAYYYYQQLTEFRLNPQKAAQEETQTLVERVSKLLVLPADEQPTVATVVDPDRLKSQPFFANAKRGDKVLIYTNARKAILYNPVTAKIIEVAPINIGAGAAAATTTAAP